MVEPLPSAIAGRWRDMAGSTVRVWRRTFVGSLYLLTAPVSAAVGLLLVVGGLCIGMVSSLLPSGSPVAVLLIVVVALSLLLWKAFLRDSAPGRARRAALASTGVLSVGLALFALVTVTVSIQRAAAPFAALLPMLGVSAADGELAETVTQIRQQLADSTGGSDHARPALEAMVSDYVRYHVVRAIAVVPMTLVCLGASVVFWRKRPRRGSADRRTRRVLGSFAAVSAVLSLFFIMLFVANQSTAADPEPGLLAFFNGSW